ncbi:6-bladed beta-propeller [Pedobacter steynii]
MRAQQFFKFSAILCLIAIVGFGALAQKVIPVDTSKMMTLRIDPMNANGGNASEIFESVTYIPLETTKESTFGIIEHLEVTDDRFVILDKNTNCILLFKKDGKFVGKIKGATRKMRVATFLIMVFGFEILNSTGGQRKLCFLVSI